MPWIQWHLPKTTQMIGIMISSRNRLSAGQLKHLEVRAGTSFVEDNFTGKMRINELCGSFDGPGKNRRVYTIMCKNEIEADYVSLQILDLDSVLEINELEIIPKSQGKQLVVIRRVIWLNKYLLKGQSKVILRCVYLNFRKGCWMQLS